jgi:hypothetical protein
VRGFRGLLRMQDMGVLISQTVHCPRCGSGRVAPSRISGIDWPASFQPDEINLFAIPFSGAPSGMHLDRACACIECGHVWADVSPLALRAVIEKWGSKALKTRLLENDGE